MTKVREQPQIDKKALLEKCADLIKQGRKIDAIATYRRDAGCSLTQAKAILNL